MGYITDKMQQQRDESPCVLDAAAILDTIATKMIQMEPDSTEDRMKYWGTLVAGILGCCSAAIGFEAAGVIGEQAVAAIKNAEGCNGGRPQ